MEPRVEGERHVYVSRRRQLLLATSLVALFLAGTSLIFERDPDTGLRPVPSDYVWTVVPCAVLIAVLAWRASRARIVTDRRSLDIVRVVGHERVPWRSIRRFEVHPTPGRQGSVVLARLLDERLVTVRTEIVVRPVRDRAAARAAARARAVAVADVLEADRLERVGPGRRTGGGPADVHTAPGPAA